MNVVGWSLFRRISPRLGQRLLRILSLLCGLGGIDEGPAVEV